MGTYLFLYRYCSFVLSPLLYGTIFINNSTFSFLLYKFISLIVNSYTVCCLLSLGHLMVRRLSLQEIELCEIEISCMGKWRSHKRRRQVLFIPPALLRNLWFAHEAGAAVPPVLDEVLGCPVYFIITATTEEGDS